MPNALTLIRYEKLGGDSATWNFTSIPTTYQTLIIRGQVRLTTADATQASLRFRLNNNTATTYNTSDLILQGGSMSQNYNSHQNFGRLEYINGSIATAQYASIFEMRIEDYGGSSDKRVNGWIQTYNTSDPGYHVFSVTRTSFSSAISEINFFNAAANIAANSQIWLFGLPES